MRNKIIILSLVMVARLGFGQTFAPVGAKWTILTSESGLGIPAGVGYRQYEILKDTVLEALSAKIVRIISKPAYLDISSKIRNVDGLKTTFTGVFMRLNGSKAEIKLNPNSNFWTTMYDSTWTLNSTCSLNFNHFGITETINLAQIIDTGSVLMNGKKIKWSKVKLINFNNGFGNEDTLTYFKNLGPKSGFNAFFYNPIYEGGYEYLNCYSSADLNVKLLIEDCDYFLTPPAYTFTGLNQKIKSENEIIITNSFDNNFIEISGATTENFPVNVYDSMGKKVLFSTQMKANNKFELWLNKHTKGIYFVVFNNYSKIFKILL